MITLGRGGQDICRGGRGGGFFMKDVVATLEFEPDNSGELLGTSEGHLER